MTDNKGPHNYIFPHPQAELNNYAFRSGQWPILC